MINNKLYFIFLSILMMMIFQSGCENSSIEPEKTHGSIKLEFIHNISDKPIIFDNLLYTNEAGNQYLVNEIQYFISEVKLHKNDGSTIALNNWENILYIDTDLSETSSYTFRDEIVEGDYSKLSFTFGITEEKNQSLMFVNPPRSFMFWPENLGGGYHYMKLNGKWINETGQQAPFNFHLGIGQIYHSYPDSITNYVQNYFEVKLPDLNIPIKRNETTTLQLIMNVENWFNSPNIYDHNTWGGDIMQKQEAMGLAIENGQDVFSYRLK